MDYSAVGKFSFWASPEPFAHYSEEGKTTEKNYLPDLLYDHYEKYGRDYARGILDMKNKTSSSFSNADIYQMNFYSQALKCKKVILCYPYGGNKPPNILRFDDERLYLQKIFSVYFNLVGNSAAEFKANIKRFVQQVDGLI